MSGARRRSLPGQQVIWRSNSEAVPDSVTTTLLLSAAVATASVPAAVSVGVAVARSPDQPISELLDEADHALYRAKRTGRDRVVRAA